MVIFVTDYIIIVDNRDYEWIKCKCIEKVVKVISETYNEKDNTMHMHISGQESNVIQLIEWLNKYEGEVIVVK
jgi:hypothetical protein